MLQKNDTVYNFLFVNTAVQKSNENALLLVGILYKEFTPDIRFGESKWKSFLMSARSNIIRP